jgi:lipopolysaccharide transport system ATP-binding protein
MEDNISISLEHVSKRYWKLLTPSIWCGIKDIGRNVFGLSSRSHMLRRHEFWAVNDVSFEVRKGETFSIIGTNGSGKTMVLKMLNGIFWPTISPG